ncbi:MAG: FIST C-terminal domain-containing protein [Bacteroidetes bacterium]|nr:FIST C-terminal domain-containing protein [Bacteroidota bacterium]
MKQLNYNIPSIDDLNEILQSKELTSFCGFKSLLVQIFSAKNEREWYQSLGHAIRNVFSSAVIIGASSVGEINEGKIITNSTVILFSFFENATLNIFSYDCLPGNEESIGKTVIGNIKSLNTNVRGLLLLSTPTTSDSGKLFNSITDCDLTFPVFGGGAGDYANERKSLIFDGQRCFEQGAIAVAFSGNDLYIEPRTYLGWFPMSKEMTITEVGNMSVKTIDGNSAFSVYEKYLGIKADNNFFRNCLEFPFLINRKGQSIARVPFFVNEKDGSIQLVADMKAGETFRIGYGDPKMILAESIHIQNQMQVFKPEAIFLYTCICRRFLMQQEIDRETEPFNKIAPTAGFYTFGEFFADKNFSSLLNSTMVAVGFREGAAVKEGVNEELNPSGNVKIDSDPYTNQHTRIISRLLYFINAIIKELEEQNQLLLLLDEQKNEFLGIAAHDLRNPLGIIQGFADLLNEEIGDEFKVYTGTITRVSSEMLNLLNDFLDISKIEAGKLDLKKERIDYFSFIKHNIMMNGFMAQNKKINIISEFEMADQILSIDGGKIDQVLNNLISNAVKYSYPDTTVVVKVFREKNQIVTQVIDHGLGIPENEIDGIFNPFKKTSVRPTGGENSHGLGLAIVKKIIEGHNGEVGVTSELGKGSVFYFTLPI